MSGTSPASIQLNPNGQATMANSSPVTIASDQSSVPTYQAGIVAPINGANVFSATGFESAQITPGGSYYLTLSTITALGATANTLASCTTAVGSTTVAYTGTAPIVGQLVVGTGITPGSYIKSVNAGVNFVISLPATAAGTVTLNVTAGFFTAVVETASDSAFTSPTTRSVIPRGYLFDAVPTSTIVSPGLYKYNSVPGDNYIRVRIVTIGLTGVAGNATSHAVRINIDGADKSGGSVAIPYVSYVASTAATFPTGLPFIIPSDMTGIGYASVGLTAFSGTSQTITWQQSGDDAGATRNGMARMTTSSAQASSAITDTAAGEYLLAPAQRYLSAFLSGGTAVSAMTVSGVYGSIGGSLPLALTVNSINNQPVNISQWGSQTPITAQFNGATNRGLIAGIAGPTSNTDYSAQAWAAASGSGAVIAEANGLGAAAAFDVNLTAWTAGASTGLDIYLQESPDNGTTYYDIWQCEALTAVSRARIPAIPIGGRRRFRWVNRTGAATTATVTITAMEQSVSVEKQVQFFDRTASVTSGTAALGNGAAYPIYACKALTFVMQTGTATAAASFKIQMSMDGTNFYDASSATSCPASSMTVIPLTAGVYGRFARFVCTVAGTSALVTAGHIYGTN